MLKLKDLPRQARDKHRQRPDGRHKDVSVGEAGFPVEYYSLVDLAVGTRPYINTDLGHLLVRTDCLATGETIGHDLCQTR